MGKQQNDLDKLYNAVSSKFDIGDVETFKTKMQTPEQRRSFYDKVSSQGFDLGDYNSYESRLGKQSEVTPIGSTATSQTSVEPTLGIGLQEEVIESPNGNLSEQSSGSDFIAKLNQRNIEATKLRGLDENVALQEFVTPEGTEVVEGRANEYGFPIYAQKNADGTYSQGGSILEQVDVSVSREEAQRRANMTQDDLIESNEPLSFQKSVINSVKNVWNQLQGADDRLKLFSTDTWSKILGDDIAKAWYAFEGRDIDKIRLDAYAELDRLGKEALPTLGIVEGLQTNSLPSIAAGVVNGVTSIFSTALVSVPTGGAGLVTEMVGGGIYDYNEAKAKSLGIGVDQLIKEGKADFWTPAAIGAVSAGLEKFGLKGVKNSMLKELSGPFVKKLSSLGLEMNKEGMTEWVQTGLEAYSEAIAQGKSVSDATNELVGKMFSDEGLESYLQGLSGSGGIAAGGRLAKSVVSKSAKDNIIAESEKLQGIVNDLANNTDPAIKSQLIEAAGEISTNIQAEKQKDNDLISKLSPEQLEEVSNINSEIESIDKSLEQGNLSEQTVEYLNGKKEELSSKVEDIVTTVPPSTELTPEQIDQGVEAQRKANPDVANIPMGELEISDDVFDVLSSVDSKEAVGDAEIAKATESLYEKKKELKSLKNNPNRSHTVSEIDEAIKGIDSDLETLSSYKENPVVSKLSDSDFKTVKPGDSFEEGIVKSSKLLDDGSVDVTMEDGAVLNSKDFVKDEVVENIKEVVPAVEEAEPVKLVEDEKIIEDVVEPIAEVGSQDKDVDVEQEQVESIEFSSPEEADLNTLKNTTDPKEVLRIYDRWENTDDTKQSFIANNISKVNSNDYASNADRNNLIGNKRLRKWVDPKNTQKLKLDVMAEDMSDRYGQEITVQDIIDFMSEYDSAKDYSSKSVDNNVRIEAGAAYQKLTGRNITENALSRQRRKDIAEADDNTRVRENERNMSEIGVTDQEVVDRQNMESEQEKVAVKEYQRTDGPVTQATLLKGVSERLKSTGLANSVRIEDSATIEQNTGRSGGDVKGYVDKDGNIIVNKDTASLDTPIHELSHVWTDKVKQSNKPLFDRGVELIQTEEGKSYVDHVRDTQPNLTGDALYEEALAQAIGDSGARLIKSQERSKITEWLKAAWDYIGGLVGISGKTAEQISNMSLREYSDAVAVDLLSGKPIVGLPNGDIMVSDDIVKATSKSSMTADEKKVADFMERMRNRNTVRYQGSVDGDPSSFSDAELADFVDVVQSLMKTGAVSTFGDLRTFAKGLGIENEGQIRYAWRANHPDAAIGINKSLVDAKTIIEADFEKMSDADYIELGKRLVDQGLIDVNELMRDVLTTGRVLEPYEVTALIYGRSLDESRIDDLYKESKPTPESKAELDSLLNKLNEYDLLILQTANAQSAAFRLRGVLTDKDYNVLHYIQAMDKIGDISPELRAQLEELGREMEVVKSELRNKVAELEAIQKQTVQNNINKTSSRKTSTPKPTVSRVNQTKADALSSLVDLDVDSYGLAGLSFQMGGLRFSLNSNSNLITAIQDGISSIQNDVSNNGVTLDQAIENAIDAINNAVGKGKWNELKFRSDILNNFIAKGNSTNAKKPYVGSDGKLVVPTSYLKQIVSDYHSKNSGSEMTIEQMVNVVLDEVGSGFNGRDIMDAISRYGIAASNTRSDEMSNIQKARTIGKLLAELDDLEKTHVISPKKGGNPVDQRVKDIRKAISDLEDSITWTPEEKAQARADKALGRKIKYMNDYISTVEEKIKNKDFEPERKTPLYDFSNHPEVISIEKKREEIRNKFKAAKYAHELENRSNARKVVDVGIALLLNLTRGITAGADLSSFLIQGGLITASMPGRSAKALKGSIKNSLNESDYLDYFNELQRDPFFDIARKASLNMQLPNFYQSIVEEQIGAGNPATYVYDAIVDKVIKNKELAQKFKDRFPFTAAERQYAIFLSDIRFNLFKEIAMDMVNYKGLDLNSKSGQELLSKVAEGVNDVTMASNIGFLKGASQIQTFLNHAFFSVRKLAANFKLLYKIPYYSSAATVNMFARMTGNKDLERKTDVDAMLFDRIYGATAGRGLAVMAGTVLVPTLIANAVYDEDEDEEPPMFYNPYILNPIHSDFMKLKMGETRFSPFLGIEGAIVFLARQAFGGYMTTTSSSVRMFGEKSGMRTNDTRFESGLKFFANKLAPTPSLVFGWAGSEFQQRESNDRLAKSFGPMWLTGAMEEYDKNQNIAFAIGTTALSIFGANFNTYGGAEFASKEGTNNKDALGIMRRAGLTDYTPEFRNKKYGVFEDGSFVNELSEDVMKKTYAPAYNKYMTKAVIANGSDLNNKSTNSETKEGVFGRIKRDGYAYAELKSTGVIVDKDFVTFTHYDENGVGAKYRLTKSQYKEKVDLINKFKSSQDYQPQLIREDVIESLGQKKGERDGEYIKMKVDLKTYSEANKWANEQLSDRFVKGKYVKDSDFTEQDNEK